MHRRSWLIAVTLTVLASALPGVLPSSARGPSPAVVPSASPAVVPGASPAPAPGPGLEGIPWRLAEMPGETDSADPDALEPLEPLEPAGPHVAARLTLHDGLARGASGCNAFGARYRLLEDGLLFEGIETTEQSCAADIMVVERVLYTGLERTSAYALEAHGESWQQVLTLLDDAGRPLLRFRRDDAAGPADGPWRLAAYHWQGQARDAIAGIDALVSFDALDSDAVTGTASGSITGTTGCNSFSGTWESVGNALTVGPLATTKMGCLGDLGDQERAVLGVLGQAPLELAFPPGSMLMTTTDGAAALTWTTLAALEGRAWVLASLRGKPVDARVVITLLLADGRVSGEVPCGTYRGTYELGVDRLSLSGRVGDRRPCQRPERQSQRAYLAALRHVVGYAVRGSTLTLFDGTGQEVARLVLPGGP